MRILITGGAGFIGSHLTETLLRAGHDVVVYDNLRTGSLENLAAVRGHPRLAVRQADVLDATTLDLVCRDYPPDALVHLAALVSVQDARRAPNDNFRLNVEATHRVICAATDHKIARVVFASSAAVYGDNPRLPLSEREIPTPIGPYGGAKAASELLLAAAARDYGFDAVSLRFFNVFGPRQRPDSPYSGVISIFADRVRRGQGVTIFGDGHQTRDFVPVREIAAAIQAVLEAPGQLNATFNVCTGAQTSLRQLVSNLEQTSGRTIEIALQPARTGDIVHSGGSPHALATTVGFRPRAELSHALRELL